VRCTAFQILQTKRVNASYSVLNLAARTRETLLDRKLTFTSLVWVYLQTRDWLIISALEIDGPSGTPRPDKHS